MGQGIVLAFFIVVVVWPLAIIVASIVARRMRGWHGAALMAAVVIGPIVWYQLDGWWQRARAHAAAEAQRETMARYMSMCNTPVKHVAIASGSKLSGGVLIVVSRTWPDVFIFEGLPLQVEYCFAFPRRPCADTAVSHFEAASMPGRLAAASAVPLDWRRYQRVNDVVVVTPIPAPTAPYRVELGDMSASALAGFVPQSPPDSIKTLPIRVVEVATGRVLASEDVVSSDAVGTGFGPGCPDPYEEASKLLLSLFGPRTP